jgi:uncharacterized protein YjbI with pentapeptide repeats
MDVTSLKRISDSEIAARLAAHKAYCRGTPGGIRARFDYCDLSGAKFIGLDLADVDFTGAKLDRADFTGSKLSSAAFFGADLRCAKLMSCDLRRADLRGALVHGADLSGSDLSGADLREGVIARKTKHGELVTIQHDALAVNAGEANFRGANLNSARMSGIIGVAADFSYANMRNVKLVRAHLKQAILVGCDLSDADLSGADLEGADMRGAILIGATTLMMRTRGVDMRDVIIAPPSPAPEEIERISNLLDGHVLWHTSDGRSGAPASFNGLDLRGCGKLAGKSLAGLKARDAILFGMDLTDVQLQGAMLAGADLRGVDLSGADLRGANLVGARLQRARLHSCRLSPLVISGDRQFPADVSSADLTAADLTGADLRGIKTDNTIFTSATLDKAIFNRDILGKLVS